jgi:hypothetical protein
MPGSGRRLLAPFRRPVCRSAVRGRVHLHQPTRHLVGIHGSNYSQFPLAERGSVERLTEVLVAETSRRLLDQDRGGKVEPPGIVGVGQRKRIRGHVPIPSAGPLCRR